MEDGRNIRVIFDDGFEKTYAYPDEEFYFIHKDYMYKENFIVLCDFKRDDKGFNVMYRKNF